MQDFLLGVLLFVSYLCAVSCLFYKPIRSIDSVSTPTITDDATQKPETNPSLQASIDTVNPPKLESYSNNELSQNPEPEVSEQETTTELAEEAPTTAQLLIDDTDTHAPAVNLIKDLKLLEARKVASQLNIRQKVNGVNKKLDFLQQEICQKLQSTPEQVTTLVTQIIAARKPRTSRVQTSLAQKLPA